MKAKALAGANVTHVRGLDVLEQVQRFPILNMIGDGEVPPHEVHITFLALAVVPENAVWLHTIRISVLQAGIAGKHKHVRCRLRRRNSALPLAAMDSVDVGLPVVDLPNLKLSH